jgi:hypothetical protein
VRRPAKLLLAGGLAAALVTASRSRWFGSIVVSVTAESAYVDCPPDCKRVCDCLMPVAGGLWRRCAAADCIARDGSSCLPAARLNL